MGRGRNKAREGGAAEDQYGERFQSQDRDSFQPSFSSGKMSGGGEAGGTKSSSQVSYQRHVPKFLQAHMHLLGKPAGEAGASHTGKEHGQLRPDNDSDVEDNEDEEALQRAVAEDPSLAAQHPELDHLARKAQAGEAKQKGNAAFSAKRYEEAILHFTKSIELDATNEIYFSNRAAAYNALKQFAEGARDAKSSVKLKPTWAKGWARLGAALVGLEDFSGAVEAYKHAIEHEPSDQSLQDACHKAQIAEQKQSAARKHKFQPRSTSQPARKVARVQIHPDRVVKAAPLSFAGESEEEDADR